MSDCRLGLEATVQFWLISASCLSNLSDRRLGPEATLQFWLISASRLSNLSDRRLGPEATLQFWLISASRLSNLLDRRLGPEATLQFWLISASQAYVTVLHSSEAYVCGAIALAQSIIQKNSSRDLVLLHDKSISGKSLRGLRAAGWKTKWISRIRSPFAKKDSYNEWNYSKLRVWQLIEYDKIIFIDSDLLVLKNIDEFFFYPELSAAGNDKVLFNSGVMVIEPSLCKFEDMMLKSFKVSSYNGGDQGFLNEVFTWWHRLPKRINHLKPWMCYKDYDCNWDMVSRHIFASDSAHKKWWQVYDAMPKKLQQYCALTKHMDKRVKKWRRIAENASLANGHWKIKPKDPRQYHIVDNK
ncbi:hypothetical protein WN943_007724 [Citrus x changshan-huyou]